MDVLAAIIDRLLRQGVALALGLGALTAIAAYSSLSEPDQPTRLSVVGHWASRQKPGQPVRIGQGVDNDVRLLDRAADPRTHAELIGDQIWNLSQERRLWIDGREITSLELGEGDHFTVHVPSKLGPDASARRMASAALPAPRPGTRPIEIEVRMSRPLGRLLQGQLLKSKARLVEAWSGRRRTLDPLEVYPAAEGLLLPSLEGFLLRAKDGTATPLVPGQVISLDQKTWQAELTLESPKKLLAAWPMLHVRDADRETTLWMSEQGLDFGDWGRLDWIGSKLRYRDRGARAALEIHKPGQDAQVPGRAKLEDGGLLKFGKTRYRLRLEPGRVRLEVLPEGRIEGMPEASWWPTHYADEMFAPAGRTLVSTGTAGEPGEAELLLPASKSWGREALLLLQGSEAGLRVRALGSKPISLIPKGQEKPRELRRRTELRSWSEIQQYEAGESLELGDRLELAGLTLELRQPDSRPLVRGVAIGLATLLGLIEVIFFAAHPARRLRMGGKIQTVYDLDPALGLLRPVGQKVVLPPLEIPNLFVPAAFALAYAGMMLQLRFWVDGHLLGTPDYFLRQAGALGVGLILFLAVALRRSRPRPAQSLLPDSGGPLGIDSFVWLGMLFLLLTNLLTAVGIGSRHNGFFFRIPVIGLTIQFSAFAKLFFAVGFARMFAHGLQRARGSDALPFRAEELSLRRALMPEHGPAGRLRLGAWLYTVRQVVFLSALLGAIFGFYVVQNDLGPGLIFTMALALFLCFILGQYNRGWRGFARALGPQGFLLAGVALFLTLWLLLPSQMPLPEGPIRSVLGPVVDKVFERFNLWWEPWRFTRGEQVVQSLWTVSGAIPRLTYFSNLHSDFAFSAAVHHFGLGGGLLILGGFGVFFLSALLLGRAMYLEAQKQRSPHLYERSLTIVLGSLILVVEAAIHIGACLNFSPLTGVTLPFISSGGSSIIVSFLMVGLLAACLRQEP